MQLTSKDGTFTQLQAPFAAQDYVLISPCMEPDAQLLLRLLIGSRRCGNVEPKLHRSAQDRRRFGALLLLQ